MSDKVFFDTNTLFYLLKGKPAGGSTPLTNAEIEANRKADIILLLLAGEKLFVGVQVFNELCNVAIRRKFDWQKVSQLLDILEALCADVIPLTLKLHKNGLALRARYKLQLFDSMLLAAALEVGCTTFYSEDMQHGQVIANSMTIKNPFRT